jgi:hypothetical protein
MALPPAVTGVADGWYPYTDPYGYRDDGEL